MKNTAEGAVPPLIHDFGRSVVEFDLMRLDAGGEGLLELAVAVVDIHEAW